MLCCVVWCGVALCGVVCCDVLCSVRLCWVVLCGVEWCCGVVRGVVLCCGAVCGSVVWCGVLCCVASCCVVLEEKNAKKKIPAGWQALRKTRVKIELRRLGKVIFVYAHNFTEKYQSETQPRRTLIRHPTEAVLRWVLRSTGGLGDYLLEDTIRYKNFVRRSRPARKRENVPDRDLPLEMANTHTHYHYYYYYYHYYYYYYYY